MGRDKFLEELGISPMMDDLKNTQIEVVERETAPDSSGVNDDGLGDEAPHKTAKVKEVSAHPDGDHEAGSARFSETVAGEVMKQTNITDLEGRLVKAEEERDAAIAKVKTLEDSRKQETESAKAQDKEIHIQREAVEKEAKAAKAELEQTKAELKKAVEASKAYTCPKCGTLGWGAGLKELPESEFNKKIGKPSSFPLDFNGIFLQKVVRFKDCPNPKCDNIEEVERK